jgi:hypothetical protein
LTELCEAAVGEEPGGVIFLRRRYGEPEKAFAPIGNACGCPRDRRRWRRLHRHGGEGPDLRLERPLRAGRRAEPRGRGRLLLALGHSEAAAREIARSFNAPIARIDADYPRDFSGQWKAVSDARARALPAIRVEPIDLAPARHVFLVSPTWMFRPATPLWAYMEQTALAGKRVVLVTTGNSRFEQAEIDAFAKRIDAHGGRLVKHVFLRRGRIFWQKSRNELLQDLRDEMSRATLSHLKQISVRILEPRGVTPGELEDLGWLELHSAGLQRLERFPAIFHLDGVNRGTLLGPCGCAWPQNELEVLPLDANGQESRSVGCRSPRLSRPMTSV